MAAQVWSVFSFFKFIFNQIVFYFQIFSYNTPLPCSWPRFWPQNKTIRASFPLHSWKSCLLSSTRWGSGAPQSTQGPALLCPTPQIQFSTHISHFSRLSDSELANWILSAWFPLLPASSFSLCHCPLTLLTIYICGQRGFFQRRWVETAFFLFPLLNVPPAS